MNQDKPARKSDFLLATLRIFVFSLLAKCVGTVSCIYLLYTGTRFNSKKQSRSSVKGKQIVIIQPYQ